ncbi:Bax inhibitor-1 family protein, partial [Streptococcus pyogenes]
LIASDNQMIKRVYQATNGQVGDGWAVAMALSLYLDFINLFISLLRIFGRND